jgi:hypothetical protein
MHSFLNILFKKNACKIIHSAIPNWLSVMDIDLQYKFPARVQHKMDKIKERN